MQTVQGAHAKAYDHDKAHLSLFCLMHELATRHLSIDLVTSCVIVRPCLLGVYREYMKQYSIIPRA